MSKDTTRGAHITDQAIVVSLCPDVCKTKVGSSVVPVPYPISSTFAKAKNVSPNVNHAGTSAFHFGSFLPNVTGNEAGKIGGVKSGVNVGMVYPKERSSSVRINGEWAIRHDDVMEMNASDSTSGSNTPGQAIYPSQSPTPKTFEPKVRHKSEVVVHFRPHSKWKGEEYGFDWMRITDTKFIGDVLYKNNVGKHGDVNGSESVAVTKPASIDPNGTNYMKLEMDYSPICIDKEVNKKTNRPNTYYTPFLTLHQKDNPRATNGLPIPAWKKFFEATLELKVQVRSKPEKLYIEFPEKKIDIQGAVDGENGMKHFHCDAKMKEVTKGDNFNTQEIKLKCLEELTKDLELNVWSIPKKGKNKILAGRLKVKANDKSKQREIKVVLLNVVLEPASTRIEGLSEAKYIKETQILEKFLNQAYITPEFTWTDFNLFDNTNSDVQKFNDDFCYTNFNSTVYTEVYSKYTYKTPASNTNTIIARLASLFEASADATKYKDYYKLFYIGSLGFGKIIPRKDATGNLVIANGRISISNRPTTLFGTAKGLNSKYAVVFDSVPEITASHELFHCLGLRHSFNDKNRHTFKMGVTGNIMDYHPLTQNKATHVSINTWQWQWDVMRQGLPKIKTISEKDPETKTKVTVHTPNGPIEVIFEDPPTKPTRKIPFHRPPLPKPPQVPLPHIPLEPIKIPEIKLPEIDLPPM